MSPLGARAARADLVRPEKPTGYATPGDTPASLRLTGPISAGQTPFPIGDAIGGAAARRRLHALHPQRPGQEAAVTGFALALMLSLERTQAAPVLWVQERQAALEAGRPYGDGLAALGLDPARLVVVSVRSAMDALAAAEMGLEEAGLAGVLVELPQRLPAGMLRLGKRLSLRAEARETPCFLLHAGSEAVETPVATRWQVASGAPPTSSSSARRYVAPDFTTLFNVTLTKNRFGPLGRFRVAWRPGDPEVASPAVALNDPSLNAPSLNVPSLNAPSVASTRGPDHVPRFSFHPAPLSEPVVATAIDRPALPPEPPGGTVIAWPAA